MMNKQAFLFDMNGTMVDDMDFHIVAWHKILNSLGAEISLEKTKSECYGKNDELLERVFPGRFSQLEKHEMSISKEKQYQEGFRPLLKLIDGLGAFLDRSREAGVKMAIGSAAIPFNIDFVLDGLQLRSYFHAIVSADDVTDSKPDPETYIKCADLLGIRYADCIVFEDSPKGVEAAANAGMQSVVITTMHTREEFSNPNILFFISDYNDPQLDQLFR